MARQLTQTVAELFAPKSKFLPIPLLSSRFFSTEVQLIEIDLDSSSEIEVMGLKKLEDAIHSIIVQRLAPDWLPFRPGSSYWVPPKRRPDNILDLLGKLTHPLSEEESLAFSSASGWPSSSFFLDDSVSEYPIPVEVEVQVHGYSSPERILSEDEE